MNGSRQTDRFSLADSADRASLMESMGLMRLMGVSVGESTLLSTPDRVLLTCP